MISAAFVLLTVCAPAQDLEARVAAALEDCTMCHDGSGEPTEAEGLDLSQPLANLIGKKAVDADMTLVVPGKPAESYLLLKLTGGDGMVGDRMPQDEDPMPAEQIALISDWISGLSETDASPPDPPPGKVEPVPGRSPFHGTHQIVLPTTATLGKRTLQYRIDHRFGRFGTERGAFGLDAGVIMSFALAYGILDGWDVLLRRTNSRKDWELGTKYVPLRQEAGMPLSLAAYASMEYLRDFDVANELTGNIMLMASRLWFERWSTMLAVGYHFNTNHNSRVIVDKGDGPVAVEDTRDTVTLGLASTVWLGKKKKWGVDLEYFIPIPDGGKPNKLHYLGGDAGPDGLTQIGAWSLGGSLRTGLHFFQVFVTNNRQIHTNLWAPGGQTDNPFDTPGVDRGINEPNFYLGFNLARKFKL